MVEPFLFLNYKCLQTKNPATGRGLMLGITYFLLILAFIFCQSLSYAAAASSARS